MSCPSGYQEYLISLKKETFSLVQNSNFLWFCNGKISFKVQDFPSEGLWVVIIKALTRLPAGFCPWIVPSSVEPLCQMPSPALLCPISATNTPQSRTGACSHSGSSCQVWREVRKGETLNYGVWVFRPACSPGALTSSGSQMSLHHSITHTKGNQPVSFVILYCPSINQSLLWKHRILSLGWLSPATRALL